MNFFKEKNKTERKLKDIDKYLKELEKNVEAVIDPTTKQSQVKSKLQNINKDIENLYKLCIKDSLKTDNNLEFSPELDYFLEKNIFRVLVDYCCFKNIELIQIIVPYLEKIVTEIKDEMFLMNSGIINSIKVLIVALFSLIKHSFSDINQIKNSTTKDSEASNLVEIIISFIYLLLNKIIIYPNFYASISISEEKGKNFDTVLFDLIVEVFSKEHMISKRDIKSKIRKSILLCLNLENFYSEMNFKDIETLIQGLIINLIEYYESFKQYDNNHFQNMNKDIIKKEKLTALMFETLSKEDIKSYLKYISVLVYCFSETKFKVYIPKVFFQMFLVDVLQKDLRNETKLHKVFEFIFYLSSIIKNKEFSEKIFEFFFGLSLNNEYSIKPESNNYDDDESILYIKKNMIEGLGGDQEDVEYLSNNNNILDLVDKKISMNNFNYLSNEKIIQKIVSNSNNNYNNNHNPNLTEVIKTEIEKIERDNHKYEDIVALLIKIIEGNQMDLKILLLNCLNNIIQNSPKLFLSEMLIPYYKTLMHPNNINEIIFQYLFNNYEKIEIVEIIKQIQPSFIFMNYEKWNQYFDLILENTFKKNMFLINHLSNKTENDLKLMEFPSESFYKNDIKGLNQTIVEDKNSISIISENNYSNEVKFKDLRINFYEILTKLLKNFIHNKYQENLFVTKLFLTIFSIPNVACANETDFNFYNNINFSTNKKANYNFLSSISLINQASSKIDEEIKNNYYDKSVVGKWVSDRYKEKELLQELENTNKKPESNSSSVNSKIEFIDNIILFTEFYKEYIANIYIKCQFDYTSKNYSKLFNK